MIEDELFPGITIIGPWRVERRGVDEFGLEDGASGLSDPGDEGAEFD
jgi:hypothetical protein